MKLKSLMLTAFVVLGAMQLHAQSTAFRLRAGVNFQNITGKDVDDDKLENKLKAGFHIGASADIPIVPDYYVQPGILFSTKGAKAKDVDQTINISYIEIPVNFLYKPTLGNGKLLAGFGPYIAFGVGGKTDDEGEKNDIEFKKTITVGDLASDKLFLKRFDAGANILFGYEFSNQIFTQLNAQLGLVKINPEIEGFDSKASWKNTGFGVSVGYRF